MLFLLQSKTESTACTAALQTGLFGVLGGYGWQSDTQLGLQVAYLCKLVLGYPAIYCLLPTQTAEACLEHSRIRSMPVHDSQLA